MEHGPGTSPARSRSPYGPDSHRTGEVPMIRSALLAAALCLWAGLAAAAPKAELWPRWQTHDPQSTRTVDHSAWDRFLRTYVVTGHPSGVNRVRYAAVTPADRANLRAYLDRLEATPVGRLNRAEQKAFWINLYNALTVWVVLENYPVESIRDIRSGWFRPGPWDRKLVAVEGVDLTLNDIEHRILRPIFRDNRVHYAVNCASIGCPNLRPEAFTADNTEALLDRAAREYVNHPRGARLEGDRLVLSSIYDWFQEDFGGSEAGVLAHLTRYARPELARALKGFRGTIDYAYDWSLNDAGP